MWTRLGHVHVLLHVASLWRQPSLLVMTHMRWRWCQSGHESTDYTLRVVSYVGGLQAWPIDRCSKKDAG